VPYYDEIVGSELDALPSSRPRYNSAPNENHVAGTAVQEMEELRRSRWPAEYTSDPDDCGKLRKRPRRLSLSGKSLESEVSSFESGRKMLILGRIISLPC
jgi:hypothetical protein